VSAKYQRRAQHQLAKRPGNKPPPAMRFRSRDIMALAGSPGMVSIRAARNLCGYRHLTPSKYEPT
jgi:hypothetical protein